MIILLVVIAAVGGFCVIVLIQFLMPITGPAGVVGVLFIILLIIVTISPH